MYRQKRKTRQVPEGGEFEQELRQRLTVSGGVTYSGWNAAGVRDRFRQGFDQLGRSNAEKRGAGQGKKQGQERNSSEQRGASGQETSGEKEPIGKKLRGFPNEPLPLQKFSDVAFRRGNLAGSILQGTGKMMLVSCLRRTLNPRRPEPHEALEPGLKRLPVTGQDPDAMVFTRDLVRGAVSIVVDTLHDSRRTLDTMMKTVQDGGPGAQQLYKMYPFLDDSPEKQLREECSAALANARDETQRAALQSALAHAEATIESKDRMRLDFLTSLRHMSDQARAAEEEFESNGFEESVTESVLAPEEDEPIPPETPPDDDGGWDKADGTQRSEPEREDTADDPAEYTRATGEDAGA